jgi:muscleblind protein
MLGASRLTDRTPVFVAAMKDVSTPGPAPPTKTERDQPSLFDPNSTVGASSSSAAKTLPEEEAVNGETASSVQQQQATATEAASTAAAAASRHGRERDSSWLELEACREHLRQMCPRQADECRYAHLDQRIYVKDGRVTCCYDFLKDRCYREKCRYFHPPIHIKERLVSAGKQFGAMMSNLYTVPGAPPSTQFHNNSFSHLNGPPLPLVAPVIYSPDGRVMSAAPPGLIPNTPYGTGAERIDICPYFSQGKCNNPVCLMIHPEPHIRLNMDSTVTVCRDFVRGGCTREQCRYFHPPGGMMAHLDSGAVPAVVQQPWE